MNSADTDDSIVAVLSSIGLSEASIRTYLALLSRGESTTRPLAEDAGITQRAVYDIVERLADRGLVHVNDHASPTTVRAVSPDEAISGLTSQLDSIRPELEERFVETAPQTTDIQMIKSRETVLKQLHEAVETASNEVLLSIPAFLYPELEPTLKIASERGIFILLILSGPNELDETPESFDSVATAVRRWKQDLTVVSVVDNETAMIGDPALLSDTNTTEEYVSLSQRHLAGSVAGLYLSGYWPASTEVFVVDPEELPRTFGWFRRALLYATLHYHAGQNLHATIETTTDDTISGLIIDLRQALVEPFNNEFALEQVFVVESDAGSLTIGGPGSFAEDYEADSVTLRPLE
ncbi:TrmB family transcriptional regulator [Halococcus salsus]|uniref:TrmB family transcriptional regulator n=1 Tax=Halococcus salsus TaxID=2162894 RepID=UPI0013573073|nr:TrmB family transcriptional regulator [Halococcus salsus]